MKTKWWILGVILGGAAVAGFYWRQNRPSPSPQYNSLFVREMKRRQTEQAMAKDPAHQALMRSRHAMLDIKAAPTVQSAKPPPVESR